MMPRSYLLLLNKVMVSVITLFKFQALCMCLQGQIGKCHIDYPSQMIYKENDKSCECSPKLLIVVSISSHHSLDLRTSDTLSTSYQYSFLSIPIKCSHSFRVVQPFWLLLLLTCTTTISDSTNLVFQIISFDMMYQIKYIFWIYYFKYLDVMIVFSKLKYVLSSCKYNVFWFKSL